MWDLQIDVLPWEAQPSLDDGWLSGFVEGDGGFYTNIKTGFRKGKLSDGSPCYRFALKFYITQAREDQVLLSIRDLLKAENKLYFSTRGDKIYTKLEISNMESITLVIAYFNNFKLLRDKNIWFPKKKLSVFF
jgi:LAGLIDADG endonuclease